MKNLVRKLAAACSAMLLAALPTASLADIKVPASGESPTIDRILAAGELDAGAAILAPWLLQDPENSSYLGPVAIIAKAAADALNVKLNYTDATWDTLIAGLVAQKYHIAAAAILETEQRKKVISFVTFGQSGTCYVVRPDSAIKSFADLNNPELVYLGYTGLANGTMFHEKYPDTGMQTISPPPGYAPRVPEVLKGRGDIAALDSPLAFWVSKRWPDARIVPEPEECLSNPDLVRPIGIGYPKGDEVFAAFLVDVVAANQEEIEASTLQFSQPEWLDNK